MAKYQVVAYARPVAHQLRERVTAPSSVELTQPTLIRHGTHGKLVEYFDQIEGDSQRTVIIIEPNETKDEIVLYKDRQFDVDPTQKLNFVDAIIAFTHLIIVRNCGGQDLKLFLRDENGRLPVANSSAHFAVFNESNTCLGEAAGLGLRLLLAKRFAGVELSDAEMNGSYISPAVLDIINRWLVQPCP